MYGYGNPNICTDKEDHNRVIRIREYLAVMRDEPNGWIRMSEVYHALKRSLGDE